MMPYPYVGLPQAVVNALVIDAKLGADLMASTLRQAAGCAITMGAVKLHDDLQLLANAMHTHEAIEALQRIRDAVSDGERKMHEPDRTLPA